MNAEPVEGAIYQGIPNEIWQAEGGEQRMTRLRPEQTYLFHRDRTVVTVTKGHALVRVSNPDGKRQAWWFHHPDLWRHEGKRVALYFDKTCPEANPTLVHAEGREINQVIGEAAMVDGCPQFALGFDAQSTDTRGAETLARRQDFNQAVRAEYRALGLRHTIARGSYATDGRGRSARKESAEPLIAHRAAGGEAKNFRTAAAERLANKAIERRSERFNEDALLAEVEGLEAAAWERGELLKP